MYTYLKKVALLCHNISITMIVVTVKAASLAIDRPLMVYKTSYLVVMFLHFCAVLVRCPCSQSLLIVIAYC